MSCPADEPLMNFYALRAPEIHDNIRNSLIFLRKMATFSFLAEPIDIKKYANIYFMYICPLAHIIF